MDAFFAFGILSPAVVLRGAMATDDLSVVLFKQCEMKIDTQGKGKERAVNRIMEITPD
jgi:hypothetical protein